MREERSGIGPTSTAPDRGCVFRRSTELLIAAGYPDLAMYGSKRGPYNAQKTKQPPQQFPDFPESHAPTLPQILVFL